MSEDELLGELRDLARTHAPEGYTTEVGYHIVGGYSLAVSNGESSEKIRLEAASLPNAGSELDNYVRDKVLGCASMLPSPEPPPGINDMIMSLTADIENLVNADISSTADIVELECVEGLSCPGLCEVEYSLDMAAIEEAIRARVTEFCCKWVSSKQDQDWDRSDRLPQLGTRWGAKVISVDRHGQKQDGTEIFTAMVEIGPPF